MEGKGVDCLFGLDMLKRYQASIDLGANALIINGERSRFLDEHELPDSAKELGGDEDEVSTRSKADAAASTSVGQVGGQTLSPPGSSNFPGSGQKLIGPTAQAALSAAPSAATTPQMTVSSDVNTEPTSSSAAAASSGCPETFPPASIKALQDLGASKVQARALLEAAGGNVEVAAGLLFHGQ